MYLTFCITEREANVDVLQTVLGFFKAEICKQKKEINIEIRIELLSESWYELIFKLSDSPYLKENTTVHHYKDQVVNAV
jgi:hypothetical protein